MGDKKCGAWVITVRDKPPAFRRGEADPAVEEAMRREGCRKPKRRPIKYIK